MTNHLRLTGLPMMIALAVSLVSFADIGEIRAESPSEATEAPPANSNLNSRIDRLADRGIEFLRTRGQSDDGAFSGETGAAVTGLCVRAILEHRPTAINTDPVVKKSLEFLESKIQPDGGIYQTGSLYRNYETSTAVLALIAANQAQSGDDSHRKYDSILRRAEMFLKEIQWDEGEGITPKDTEYGGAGYGSHSRPDLSNTSFLIEALHELGNDADDEAIQKALKFVARTQNLAPPEGTSDGNDTVHGEKIGDGGFYYTPAAGGQSKAGEEANGGLRSYGSMTYAGLKSMIYAGLSQDDPRVEAALGFIRENYSLEKNPGMGAQGLFYYYHTFAKALDVAGLEVVDAEGGSVHDWREELVATLEANQQADGSWVNRESDRWMEGDRQLVTAYCLLALSHAKK
ncbi:prenyltransferase/squalene oxidase repeat-containing protein [Aporhodopirellula aestuarii]|uniref:Terpene cyclase/mutase family protein n=1 Tax=Aporhodopirellula aestuarii TaxID=2950107 RepID=A0ABT0U9M9_9BACT|nr:prenyltransferase/squalene oxidase repeat-containing protein [Aporhodopirellula aestuarii]MCM2373517.1 terpene cyclase/mutase family protein [Aporhodopirellula aestuarii]